jgi:phosphatidylglycerol:prolipoprotein diacylglycerol transferase
MHPILFEYGRIHLYTFGVFVALGFMAALWIGGREAKRYGIDTQVFHDLGFTILLSAILGARLFFVLIEWEHFAAHPLQVFAIWEGGLVYYGGFVGAGLAALWYVRRKDMPVWDTADAVAPALALGQALGRLGCFFAGCCYGAACDLPWAITFSDPRRAGDAPLGVPLHPTQLYESAGDFAIFALLYLFLGPKRRFRGQLFGVYLVAYPALRFIVECFRADPRGALGALSTSQVLGIPLFLFGIWILAKKKGSAT